MRVFSNIYVVSFCLLFGCCFKYICKRLLDHSVLLSFGLSVCFGIVVEQVADGDGEHAVRRQVVEEVAEGLDGVEVARFLAKLKKGERIVICKRNEPIAEIRPIPPPRNRKRPLGLAKGQLILTPEFFEPLPEDMIQAFHGHVS